MSLNALLRFARSLARRPAPRHAAGRRPRALTLTALEDRSVPATFTVTNLLDDGSPGSLRYAVARADATPGADTVRFSPGLAGTLRLGAEIALTTDVTIDGPASRAVIIDGKGLTRHFTVVVVVGGGGARVAIDDLTLANGRAAGPPIDLGFGGLLAGGSILNTGSSLAVTRVAFADNAVEGGAAFAAGGAVANILGGSLTATATTFRGNRTTSQLASFGGAVVSEGGSAATVTGSAFTGNWTEGAGSRGSGSAVGQSGFMAAARWRCRPPRSRTTRPGGPTPPSPGRGCRVSAGRSTPGSRASWDSRR